METGLGRNNICKIRITVKTVPREIGHSRNNGQQRKLKLAASKINSVLWTKTN